MSDPSVAVVILNWNGKDLLSRFLPGVVKSKYANLQVIVGDNASTDDSVAFVRLNFPEVTIIENDRNYGFAEGYNRILDQVTAKYYILLNSDVEVPANWISPVIALMEADEMIAAAQPKIKWQLDKSKFEYAGAAGGFLDINAFPFCRGRIFDIIESDLGQYNDVREVFWASGAAFFIKSAIWKKTGGLDPDLFAHMEEIDLCWTIHRMGHSIQYVPNSIIYHVGGATLNKANPKKTFLNFRNSLWMLQKHLPKNKLAGILFIRMCLDALAAIHYLSQGQVKHFAAVFNAHLSFYFNGKNKGKRKALSHLPFFYSDTNLVMKRSIIFEYYLKGKKTYASLFK